MCFVAGEGEGGVGSLWPTIRPLLGGTPLHPPPRQPPRVGGVCWWSSSLNPPTLPPIEAAVATSSAPSLSSLSRLHIQFPAHSPPTTFHHLIFNLRAPSFSSRAPLTCYDDASLPIATAHHHHLQLRCFVSLLSKCIHLPMAADAEATLLHLH